MMDSQYQSDRDLRLDACRGIALWFIFLDHIPNNLCSWLTLSHYGFSDTTELFMFVSGLTCASAYGAVSQRYGWWAALSHTLRRSWQIYVAFLVLVIAILTAVYWSGIDQLIDEENVRILMEDPGAAFAHAAILQYRPVNTDVLPTFILFHLLFVPVLWLLFKAPDSALGASILVYVLARLFGWNLPQWPGNGWYFNPFAWQVLVVLGAWWALGGRKRFRPLVISRASVSLAAIYLLFALFIALSWRIKALEAAIPQSVSALIYPIEKSDLDPLRLLHFLAIAVLVSRFVAVDWRRLGGPVLRAAIRCGENSLEIYCLSVLLSLGGHILLVRLYGGVTGQIAISAAGILILTFCATGLTWIRIASREQPKLF
jgi:hypothetical protein